ncbi:MAG TPA: extracellular solute-binding protein [Clostridiales bacterium]|nr:extracellular solute-binding protein [Clostridiales bacterium]
MKKIRLWALLLTVLMLTSIVAGCSGDKDPPSTTPVPGSGTTKGPDKTTAPAVEEVKMNGYEFLWAHAHSGYRPEGETANADELKEIYAQIEEKFDCKILFIDPGNGMDNLTASVISGTKIADFVRARQSSWIPLSMMGGLIPLDSDQMREAGLDLFNPNNFHQPYTLMTELNGHVWACDISGKYDQMAFGHVYAFNKRLVAEAGYDPAALFQAVRDGKWEYDLFLEIARKITKDLDGDGKYDIWGVALDTDGNEIWSNGTGPILWDEANGRWYSNLSDPKLIKSLYFMTGISGDPNVQFPLEGEAIPGRGDRRNMFYEGKAGFAGLYGPNFGEGGTFKMTDPVGLLPIPKGPDVDHYMINMVDVDTFICLTSNDGWENGAKIMNEIGYHLHDMDGYREFIAEALQYDEESVEMLFDYLLPYAKMNIAKCSDDMYQITRKEFYDSVYKGNMTPSQAAEAFEGKIQAELDKVFRQS